MSEYYEPTIVDQDAQSEENKLVRKALTRLPEPYLSGLKLNADVEINGLVLNTIDANNVVWVVSDIDGWWNLPESEIPDLPRGWGDGSYDAIGRFSTRVLTLSGSFLTQDPDQVATARSTLLNAVNLVKTGGWLIVDENPKKAAYVRLSGSPQVRSVSARGRHDFSIGLVANDPIKYEYVEGNADGYQSIFIDTPSANIVAASSSTINSTQYVTYTTSSNHEFLVGYKVKISGITPSSLNTSSDPSDLGSQIKFITSNTFTIESSVVDSYVSGGVADSTSGSGVLTNSGDVAVPIIIELSKNFTIPNANTPPTITNTENDQIITIIDGTDAENRLEIDTYNREILDVLYNYSTISGAVGDGTNVVYTTSSAHGLSEGDTVSISGITPSSLNVTDAEVIAANTLTFTIASTVTASYSSGGEAAQYLSAENGRAKASVLIDWIYLQPGTNAITLNNFATDATCTIYYRSGWLS